MYKIKLALFFTFFLISIISISQAVEEKVQLDTITETIQVVYLNTEASTYYIKRVATFKDNPSQVAVEKTISNGQQNGIYKVYYPSGRLKIKAVYANNKKNGEWTWYNPEGVILIKGEYKNDIKHGYWAYKSLKTYGRYKRGKKHGKWYKQNVNKKKKAYYKKGVLVKGEGFGNEQIIVPKEINTPIPNDSSSAEVEIIHNEVESISKEYKQAIDFLTSNIVFRKALKSFYKRDILKFKKNYKKDIFQFSIVKNIKEMEIDYFLEESKAGKIVVTKIDSILKSDPSNLKKAFNRTNYEIDEKLINYSSNKDATVDVFFSELNYNLMRIDILWKVKEYDKFRLLLYFDNTGTLKGAEYQKPQ